MKRSTRFLSVLLCFALLSIGFSTIASAEEVEVQPYEILQINSIHSNKVANPYSVVTNMLAFTPNNGEIEKTEIRSQYTSSDANMTWYTTRSSGYHQSVYALQYKDKSPVLLKDKSYKVRLNNIYHSLLWEMSGYKYYVRNPKIESVSVVYTDESIEIVSNYGINHYASTPYCDVYFEFVPSKDVKQIVIVLTSLFKTALQDVYNISNGHPYFTSYAGEYDGDNKYTFQLEVESQESGLLKSVIEWLKGIKSKIDDTFTNVSNGFSNVISNISNGFSDIGESFTNLINNILELPSKIWNFISEGLKSLFVPSEDDMSAYKSKWDSLLSSRFGAIYEVGSLITDFADSITESDKTNKITIPVVSLDSVGIPFSFGGQDVQIVPNGFNTIVEICKKAISIACTFLFVNGLRKRYDEVMGVQK